MDYKLFAVILITCCILCCFNNYLESKCPQDSRGNQCRNYANCVGCIIFWWFIYQWVLLASNKK